MLWYIRAFRKYIWVAGFRYNTCHLPIKKDCLFLSLSLSLTAPQPDKTKSFSSSLLFSSPFLLSLKHSCTCHLPSSRNLVSSNPAFASLASNLNNYQTFLFHAFSLFFPSAEIPIQHPVFSTNFIRITITL